MSEKNIDTSGEKINENQTVDRRTYLKLTGAAGSGLGAGVGTGALGTKFSTPARAESGTVVDDFTYSSGGLSDRYVFDQDAGNATVATASTVGSSDDDSNVLEVKDGTSILHAYKGDGDTDLNAYPEIGDTFSCWIRETNGTGTMNFVYGAKDKDNKYYVQLNLTNAHLGLFKYVNGSGDSFAGDWSNSTIENNTGWFEVEIQWTTDHTHTVTLYQDGSEVTSFSYTEDSNDPKFTANGVGFAGHLESGETAQFDYATTTGDSSSAQREPHYVISDRFENRDLDNAYRFDRGRDGASIVTYAGDDYSGSNSLEDTYFGRSGLKISESYTEMISLPGDGLRHYPSAGDTFSTYFMPTGGADNLNFTWGVQSHTDRYYVKVKPSSGGMYLFKYKDGDGISLDSASVSMSQDTWYWIEVHWGTDGTHTVELYDIEDNVLATVTGSDSEWTDGGIGFDAYLSSGETVYFDRTIVGSYEGHVGGWGPEPMISRGKDKDFHTEWTLYEEFKYGFTVGRDADKSTLYNFAFGGSFHTFAIDDGVTDPDKSQVHPASQMDNTEYTLTVTGPNGGDVSDEVQLKKYNTQFLYRDSSKWQEWKDNNFDSQAWRDTVRKNAIDSDKLDPERSGVGVVDIGAVVLSVGATVITGGSLWPTILISGASLVHKMSKETDCGTDNANLEPDYDYIKWDPCNDASLIAYWTEYDLEVPGDKEINVKVEQTVNRNSGEPDTTEEKAVWRAKIKKSGQVTYLDDKSGLKNV